MQAPGRVVSRRRPSGVVTFFDALGSEAELIICRPGRNHALLDTKFMTPYIAAAAGWGARADRLDMSGMPRLIARTVDRALAAVAAKVTPFLSVKRGPVPIAELHKTTDRSRDEVGGRIGDALNPQAPETNDPIAILDIGCGPQLKMLSILRDDDVVEVYRITGCFEPASLMVWFELARQSSYALDVGAYTGIYALVAAGANSEIKVAAVEPAKQEFSRLCLNIRINQFQAQIAPLNFAAGDRIDECLLNHYDYIYCISSGSTLLETGVRPFQYSERVQMLPLDSLPKIAVGDTYPTVIEIPQTGPDIVKIDVEGYELNVIAGMRQMIGSSLPIFIIECLSLENLRAAHDCLNEFSYIPLLIDEGKMSLIGDVQEYRIETTRNVLFYPSTKQSLIERVSNNSGVAIR